MIEWLTCIVLFITFLAVVYYTIQTKRLVRSTGDTNKLTVESIGLDHLIFRHNDSQHKLELITKDTEEFGEIRFKDNADKHNGILNAVSKQMDDRYKVIEKMRYNYHHKKELYDGITLQYSCPDCNKILEKPGLCEDCKEKEVLALSKPGSDKNGQTNVR